MIDHLHLAVAAGVVDAHPAERQRLLAGIDDGPGDDDGFLQLGKAGLGGYAPGPVAGEAG
ncbi:hypothetical protein AAFN88_01785 [Pelagibius sp. CAU 1746]|uniref:hypothetical protein n=1 Tax=Pelagibius sp. CAU 1746 TaxID=3140370 RepID=UPI00325A5D4B